MKRYEGVFLFDNTSIHQWSEIEAEIRRLCDRSQADLQVCVKFDERKLAYEIKGRKRGTYVLTYFDADPGHIADLERDARLSELILRTLVLRADRISDARLAELKSLPPEQPLQPMSGDGRRGEGGPHRAKYESWSEPKTAIDEREAAAKAMTEPATEATAQAATETTTTGVTEAKPRAAAETAPEAPPAFETPEGKPADE
ncbi:MAG: 30S ribosomal protein S6 [Phycisphaerae bacterium]